MHEYYVSNVFTNVLNLSFSYTVKGVVDLYVRSPQSPTDIQSALGQQAPEE